MGLQYLSMQIMHFVYLLNIGFSYTFQEEPHLARNLDLKKFKVLICRISEKFQLSIFTVNTYRSLSFLDVSFDPCAFHPLVAAIETQEQVCLNGFSTG